MSIGNIVDYFGNTEKLDDTGKETPVIRLDLACGNAKREGFVGVDIIEQPHTQADIAFDLRKFPWPWSDNSVFEINCSHYIEHTPDIKRFMEEIYRILIPKGKIRFQAPYYTSIRAWQDFTHVRPISENTFLYFTQGWMKANGLNHYGVMCNFGILWVKYHFNPEWNARSERAKEWARLHQVNVVDDIEIELQKME